MKLWKWNKRLLIGLVFVVIAVGITQDVRGRRARAKAAVTAAGLRAAGEKVYVEDFETRVENDPLDAVPLLRAQARRVVAAVGNQKTDVFDSARHPLTDEEAAEIETLLAGVPDLAAATDPLLDRPAAHWNITFARPMIDTVLPDLNPQRQLAEALAPSSYLALRRGDARTAIRSARKVIAAADRMTRFPGAVGFLVSLGFSRLGTQVIFDIAPGLPATDPAVRAEMKALIVELLDEKPLETSLVVALQAERAMIYETLVGIDNGMLAPLAGNFLRTGNSSMLSTLRAWWARPTTFAEAQACFDWYAAALRDVPVVDFPSFQRTPTAATPMKVSPLGLMSSTAPGVLQVARIKYFHLADRRLAATLLAIRLYQADHGRLPARLDDLVPAYLPAVPLDPCTSGQALRYRPDGGRPVIYSVGEEGVDDGGNDAPAPRGTRPFSASVGGWAALDRVVDLMPRPRPAPASRPASLPDDR